jgi:L-aspartate oxidase
MSQRYLAAFDLATLPKVSCDILVVGTGIAGMYTALKLKALGQVLLMTKGKLVESNTQYAQGGIAAAIGDADSPRLHLADTLDAGAGLCDEAAVQVLVEEGPDCVRELILMGTEFDRNEEGELELTREGAHSMRRILHAHGDATGAEIRRALEKQVRSAGVIVHEEHFLVDLLTEDGSPADGAAQAGAPSGRCFGALALTPEGVLTAYIARAVIVATGGAGQLYINSTNPEIATGDGCACAYRAGAEIQDVEFIQFHPTALKEEGNPKLLISEAVRGEGAHLLNKYGERFMAQYDARQELAPRDIVARAIVDQMRKTEHPCCYLDTRHLPDVKERFPGIAAALAERGIEMGVDLIPVAPAAHYIMGGIKTDTAGRTGIPGLYACGEAACTGIHGANRLASNSLLEGLVFGKRIAEALRTELLPTPTLPALKTAGAPSHAAKSLDAYWLEVQTLMWENVGILRDEARLQAAIDRLTAILTELAGAHVNRQAFEVVNLAQLGLLVAKAALARKESRGGHYRTDYPERDDAHWRIHVAQRRS